MKFLHEWEEVVWVCIGYASVLTRSRDRPRKSLAFYSLGCFGNKILNHIGHSLIASLPATAEPAHLLMGCVYITLALPYISHLSRMPFDYLFLP